MQRPYGMAPTTFKRHIQACYDAGIGPDRVTQTIGNAPASAGTHRQDGEIIVNGKVYDYCAAFDLRSRDLDTEQELRLLSELYKNLIVGWHRTPQEGFDVEHLHVIDVTLHMKDALQAQVRDWLEFLSGLRGHAHEAHAPCDIATYRKISEAFRASNLF